MRRKSLDKQKTEEIKLQIQEDQNQSEQENGVHSAIAIQSQRNVFDQNILSEEIPEENRRKKPQLIKSNTLILQQNQVFTISLLKRMEVQKSRKPKGREIQLLGKSIYLFKEENSFRKMCSKIVGHPYFDSLILFLIGFSTILLTLESPLDNPHGSRGKILALIDVIVSTIFTIELLLKVIVYGFVINGPDSYLLNSWNIMDFIIVIFSLISIIFSEGVDLGIIKVLRMLRVLRPLRMISRNPGLRIAVQSLINAIPDIGNVLVVSLLFLLLFAILGTNFFKGAFFHCHADNIPKEFIPQIKDKFDCLDFGGEWINADQNFDNVMDSIITLFNVMTTEGWIGVMWNAVDANNIDLLPLKNKSPHAVFFFIFFMIVGSLFILNMFVGIVINVFNKEKEALQLNHLLTETQKDWCDVLIAIYNTQPETMFASTGNKLIDFCHKVATDKIFDHFIFFCIVLNTICLALKWYDEPDGLSQVLESINLVFNIIYTVEAIIKFIAFRYDYFNDGWNNFDLIIVVSAWLGMIINSIEGLDIGAITTVIRSFRISRIFKIIKKYKNLRILFYTFIGAIPQLTNVGGLLFLFLFLYSVLGVFLFAGVKLQASLNIHANFQSFGGALLTLLRMSTGESWHQLMYDCARTQSITFDCKDFQSYEELQRDGVQGCGSSGAAYIFFISFMVVVSFIFLNLFIAIILESFNTTQEEEDLQVGPDTILKFNQFWKNFDPKGKGFISVSKLHKLLHMILMEEFKELYVIKSALLKGQISQEDVQNLIFMFNLHQDKILLGSGGSVKDKFFQEIKRNESDENYPEVLKQQKIQKILDDEYDPLGIYTGQQKIENEKENGKLTPEEKANQNYKRILYKDLDKFISGLRLPCYDCIKYYYYYDILEALSRNLFQMLIEKAREELELLETHKSVNSIIGQFHDISSESLSSESGDKDDINNQIDKSNKVHQTNQVDTELEQQRDIREAKFDQILYRLEQKGQKNNIFKYKEMSQLRAKRSNRVNDKLEEYGPEKSIIDSSQIYGGYMILRYYRRYQDAKPKPLNIDEAAASDRTAQGPFSPNNAEAIFNLDNASSQSGPGNKQGGDTQNENEEERPVSSRVIRRQFTFQN